MKSFSFQFDLMCVHFRKLYVMVILAFPSVWMFDCPPSQESWQRQCHSDLSIKYPYKDWQPRKNILTNRAIDIQIRPIEADYFVVQICSSVQSKGWSALLPEQTVLGVAENRRQPDSQGGVTCSMWLFLAFINPSQPQLSAILCALVVRLAFIFWRELSGQIMSTIVALSRQPASYPLCFHFVRHASPATAMAN